jgi:hypothetical protein
MKDLPYTVINILKYNMIKEIMVITYTRISDSTRDYSVSFSTITFFYIVIFGDKQFPKNIYNRHLLYQVI